MADWTRPLVTLWDINNKKKKKSVAKNKRFYYTHLDLKLIPLNLLIAAS